MVSKVITKDLIIEKAKETDWNSILNLLNETNLTHWFFGNENYKNFYVVQDKDSKSLICCFAIDTKENTGILKSFAVKKDLQGKGIGKFIVNQLPDIMTNLNIDKLYACSSEAPDFWKKTIFNEINTSSVNSNFYLKYLKDLETRYPSVYPYIKHFVTTQVYRSGQSKTIN